MNVLLFGATGMVGQGVLRECLLDSGVASVVSIGRSATGVSDLKLREIVHADLTSYATIESQLSGFGACFFCLGISSAGMTEEQYSRVTFDITVRAAETLARLNPGMTFVYVSGQGTDSSEHGRIMWARVKGRTETLFCACRSKLLFYFAPESSYLASEPAHARRSIASPTCSPARCFRSCSAPFPIRCLPRMRSAARCSSWFATARRSRFWKPATFDLCSTGADKAKRARIFEKPGVEPHT